MRWAAWSLLGFLAVGTLEAAEPPDGVRSVLVARGDTVLFEDGADQRVSPASVLKLMVAAAAVERLGPDHRAVTTVRAAAPPSGGEIAGDLVVVAGGDPTWNERFFPATDEGPGPVERLARAVRAAGVRRVRGDLVFDLTAFPGRDIPRGRALSELAYAWAAPTSGLAVDENAVSVRIAPGLRVGAPGEASGPLPVVADIRTVGADRHGVGTVDFLPLFDRGGVLVRGEYPITEPPYDVAIAVPDPVGHAAAAVERAFEGQGVVVDGSLRVTRAGRVLSHVVARLESPPLLEWLPPILGDSHNWYAEMLVRQVALASTGSGRIDDGLDQVRQVLETAMGVAPSNLVLADGSGLSADNLVSARAVVAVLNAVWRRPWRQPFVEAMATPGRGTLAAWSSVPPMAAKTGTRQGVQALAGYLDPRTSEPVMFAVLLDHQIVSGVALRSEISTLLRRTATRPARRGGND